MQWPIGGMLFAAGYLTWFAFRVHGWYHSDSIVADYIRSTANGDDEDYALLGSCLASLIGSGLSLLDLRRLRNRGGDIILARAVFTINALLWLIVYCVLDWLGNENARWIESL